MGTDLVHTGGFTIANIQIYIVYSIFTLTDNINIL